MEQKPAEDIQTKLQQISAACPVCWRCQLRHLIPTPPDDVFDSLDSATSQGYPVQDITSTCPLCLGFLQKDIESSELSERVESLIESEGRQFDCYVMNVATPVSMYVRDMIMCFKKKTTGDDESLAKVEIRREMSKIEEIKTVWKKMKKLRMWKKLDLPYFNSKFKTDENRIEGLTVFPLQMDITILDSNNDSVCAAVMDRLGHEHEYNRKKGMELHGWAAYTHPGVIHAVASASPDLLTPVVSRPLSADGSIRVDVSLRCGPLFLAGRYIKMSRVLCQTPWIVNGERRMESSVEELISGPVKDEFGCTGITFSSSGREDKDVRTLGIGRPFILEILDVKRALSMKEFECLRKVTRRINEEGDGRVKVRDLQLVAKSEVRRLKEGEEEKKKCYRALCWSETAIVAEDLEKMNSVRELKLFQETPIRVLHRRTAMTRERIVHELRAKQRDEHHFILDLVCQAGTYVKEFVHGDLGRTSPNLGTITGKSYEILLLDVLRVCCDWPPIIDEVATKESNDSICTPGDSE